MVQTTTKYICDLCKREAEEGELKSFRNFPVLTRCDWIDGMVMPEYVEYMDLDICPECLKRAVNITAGFQGDSPELIPVKHDPDGDLISKKRVKRIICKAQSRAADVAVEARSGGKSPADPDSYIQGVADVIAGIITGLEKG